MDDTAATRPNVAVPVSAVKPSRRGGALKWLAALTVLAAFAAFAWWTTLGFGTKAPTVTTDVQRLSAQVDDLTHAVAQLRGTSDTLRARLDDGDRVDKSVRDQLLALGQRARLLEDSVANLADKRLSGHDALLLDEAELLLTLGGERYALFHDAAAATTAYRLADTALSEVEDAAFSTVRQSIAAEIAAFDALHAADPAPLSEQLMQLRTQVGQLPVVAQLAPAPAPEQASRLARLLGALVQVHHDDDAQAQVALHDAGLARELAALDLRDAEVAMLARDDAAYRGALAAARAQLGAALDPHTPALAAVFARIDALSKAELAPPPPAIVGTALKQLRNLRATHALHAPPETAAKPATAKPDEAQK